jgi:hypothetical protein
MLYFSPMLTRTAALARRQAANRRLRRCRARRAAGLVVLHPVVDVAALAQVMIDAQLLPETDRHNRQRITAALQKAISLWHD